MKQTKIRLGFSRGTKTFPKETTWEKVNMQKKN